MAELGIFITARIFHISQEQIGPVFDNSFSFVIVSLYSFSSYQIYWAYNWI